MSNNNFPMWGGNKWTKLMFKKYWVIIVCLIIVSCILIISITNNFI